MLREFGSLDMHATQELETALNSNRTVRGQEKAKLTIRNALPNFLNPAYNVVSFGDRTMRYASCMRCRMSRYERRTLWTSHTIEIGVSAGHSAIHRNASLTWRSQIRGGNPASIGCVSRYLSKTVRLISSLSRSRPIVDRMGWRNDTFASIVRR